MKIQINAPWEVNEELKYLLHSKLEKLNQYFDRIISAEVFLKMKEEQGYEPKTLEVELSLAGKNLFSKGSADSFEKAIALVSKKLEVQLKRRKEKN